MKSKIHENKKNKLKMLSKNFIILSAITILGITSCVQKSYNRKVTLLLDVSGNKDIKSVGIRGENKPFLGTKTLQWKS